MAFDFEADGTINSGGRMVGYIKDDEFYSGGQAGGYGGQLVGYVKDDEVYAGVNRAAGRPAGWLRQGRPGI